MALAAALAGFCAAEAADAPPPLTTNDLRLLTSQVNNPDEAAAAVERIREIRRTQRDLGAQYDAFLRRLLVRGLVTSKAPVGEIVAEADTLGPMLPQTAGTRVLFYIEIAQALVDRGEGAKDAVRFARQALNEIPPDESGASMDAMASSVLGRAQLLTGDCSPAIRNLSTAIGALPDSQSVLYSLGAAYEKCGEPEQAIDHYVRALGVFGGRKDLSLAPVQALYTKEKGSLDGLDRRIDQARQASVQKEVFDTRRYERTMPAWKLEDLAGKVVDSKDLAGKVVVLDFWGSWCGPCRMELPHFQEAYEKYGDDGVVFYGVNMERVPRERRKAVAESYMTQNGFDFPVVVDLDDQTTKRFVVQAFPTVFLVDAKGEIRYRNEGFSETIGEILALQIESLLEESKGGKTSGK
jgi:thiol-disulfide isomerase/thioredoxin